LRTKVTDSGLKIVCTAFKNKIFTKIRKIAVSYRNFRELYPKNKIKACGKEKKLVDKRLQHTIN